jgi:Flp pilus assembly protein TadG
MRSQRSRRERGAAAVEMALVLPVLVLLLGGIIDLGRAFMTQTILTNAAREGTRFAMISTNLATDKTSIETRAKDAAGLDPTAKATASANLSTSGCGANGFTGTLTVTVSSTFNWLFLNALPGVSNPQTMTGKSTIGC